MNLSDVKSVTVNLGCACETCGTFTINTGTKRCDGCYEVERRLGDYLRRGGARALTFVIASVDAVPADDESPGSCPLCDLVPH